VCVWGGGGRILIVSQVSRTRTWRWQAGARRAPWRLQVGSRETAGREAAGSVTDLGGIEGQGYWARDVGRGMLGERGGGKLRQVVRAHSPGGAWAEWAPHHAHPWCARARGIGGKVGRSPREEVGLAQRRGPFLHACTRRQHESGGRGQQVRHQHPPQQSKRLPGLAPAVLHASGVQGRNGTEPRRHDSPDAHHKPDHWYSICTYTHTHRHTHRHTQRHRYIHTHTHTHKHTHTHTHTLTHSLTHTVHYLDGEWLVKWRFISHASAPVKPQLPRPLLPTFCYGSIRYTAAAVHGGGGGGGGGGLGPEGVALVQFLAACVLQRCTRRTNVSQHTRRTHVFHTLGGLRVAALHAAHTRFSHPWASILEAGLR
jgi:hypothetical protein